MSEIAETRRRLEADIRELEARLPAPLRSTKSVLGAIVGITALTAVLRRRFRSARPNGNPAAEVVIRIVRDDV